MKLAVTAVPVALMATAENDAAAKGEKTYESCFNQLTVCCGAAITVLAGAIAVALWQQGCH